MPDHAQTFATLHAGPDFVDDLPDADSLTNDEIAHLSRTATGGSYSIGDDGNPYTMLRGEAITPDVVDALLAEVRLADIDRACDALDATRYANDTAFAYTDSSDTTPTVYLVSADEMAACGRRLAEGQSEGYARHCLAYAAHQATAEGIIAQAKTDDLPALRAAAANAGDILTVAACDHLADAIARLLRSAQD